MTIEVSADSIEVTFRSSVTPFEVDQAVADIVRLRECKKALDDWQGELTEWLADALGYNRLEIEGVGVVEIKRGVDRKAWDRRALLRAVLDSRRAPDPVTGEMVGSDSGRAVVDDEFVSCSQDLSRVLDVWNLGAPRVTALRERGIDPGEFCETTPGRTTVVIQ